MTERRQDHSNSFFDDLTMREQQPPSATVRLFLDRKARADLKAMGVSLDKAVPVRSSGIQMSPDLHEVPRQTLQDANIAFINRVSRDNQKPILSGNITLPDGRVVNVGEYQFLTEEDITNIKNFQKKERKSRPNFQRIRKQAMDLLMEASENYNNRNKTIAIITQTAVSELHDELSGEAKTKLERYLHPPTEPTLTIIELSYIQYLLSNLAKDNPFNEWDHEVEIQSELREFVSKEFSKRFPRLSKEHPAMLEQVLTTICSKPSAWEKTAKGIGTTNDVVQKERGIDTPGMMLMFAGGSIEAKVRGATFKATPTRASALLDMPSPFVDSGLVFGTNLDIELQLPNGQWRRLNTAVIHLWGHELDEMGGMGDQIYITAEEFETFMKQTKSEKSVVPRTDVEKVKTYILKKLGITAPDQRKRR